MTASLLNIIEHQHLIITGGLREERLNAAHSVLAGLQHKNMLVFNIEADLPTTDAYLEAARSTFSIFSPLGIGKEKMSLDQVQDMHLDWVSRQAQPMLVYWEEINIDDPDDLAELIGGYVTEKYYLDEIWDSEDPFWFRLVATSAVPVAGLYQRARIFIGRDPVDERTEEDIWRRHLHIAELS